MSDLRGVPLKFGDQLRWARDRLTLPDEIGLALRSHRRHVGLSQRAYASWRGLSRSMLARLEAGESSMPLSAVLEALEGTGFALFVGFADDPATPPPVDSIAVAIPPPRPRAEGEAPRSWRPIPPEVWRGTELVARVRGGSRRFPAHRLTMHVVNPPTWWWIHEFFTDPSNPPQWYAPVLEPRPRRTRPASTEDAREAPPSTAEGAAPPSHRASSAEDDRPEPGAA